MIKNQVGSETVRRIFRLRNILWAFLIGWILGFIIPVLQDLQDEYEKNQDRQRVNRQPAKSQLRGFEISLELTPEEIAAIKRGGR